MLHLMSKVYCKQMISFFKFKLNVRQRCIFLYFFLKVTNRWRFQDRKNQDSLFRYTDIREALSIEPLHFMVEKQQLRWYGHVLRMPPERTARKVLLTIPNERRPIGRPRATWIKQINGLCRRAGIEPFETGGGSHRMEYYSIGID